MIMIIKRNSRSLEVSCSEKLGHVLSCFLYVQASQIPKCSILSEHQRKLVMNLMAKCAMGDTALFIYPENTSENGDVTRLTCLSSWTRVSLDSEANPRQERSTFTISLRGIMQAPATTPVRQPFDFQKILCLSAAVMSKHSCQPLRDPYTVDSSKTMVHVFTCRGSHILW